MKAKIKRVMISPEAFFRIMAVDTAWRVSKGIPSGARLRGVTLDPHTQVLHLFVEHESFPEVNTETEVSSVLETMFKKIE